MAAELSGTVSGLTGINTVIYCRTWQRTVDFYERVLGLPRSFTNDWFVEFRVAPGACLSLADEGRASIKSASGAGLTLTFRVTDIHGWHALLTERGASPPPVEPRPFECPVLQPDMATK